MYQPSEEHATGGLLHHNILASVIDALHTCSDSCCLLFPASPPPPSPSSPQHRQHTERLLSPHPSPDNRTFSSPHSLASSPGREHQQQPSASSSSPLLGPSPTHPHHHPLLNKETISSSSSSSSAATTTLAVFPSLSQQPRRRVGATVSTTTATAAGTTGDDRKKPTKIDTNKNNNSNSHNDDDDMNAPSLTKGALMTQPPSTAIKVPPIPQSHSKLSLLDDDDQCSICLEGFRDDNPKVAASRLCNHQFHLQCIFSWSERSETCPICASKLDID